MVRCNKSEVLAMFKAMGFTGPDKWSDQRLTDQIESLPKRVKEGDIIPKEVSGSAGVLLKKLLAAFRNEEEIDMRDDLEEDDPDDEDDEDDEDEGESDSEDEDDEDEEEDEDDEPPPRKKGKKAPPPDEDEDDEEDEEEDEEDEPPAKPKKAAKLDVTVGPALNMQPLIDVLTRIASAMEKMIVVTGKPPEPKSAAKPAPAKKGKKK